MEVGNWKWVGRWKLVVGSLLAASVVASACGKKGPPLAPIVHIPSAVEQVEVRRQGNDVSLTVTVPSKNIDGSAPVDIGRIEIYGYTGNTAPPRARFFEVGTLVGTITVPEQKPDAPPIEAPPPGTPVPGGKTTIHESLTPEALVATPIPAAPITPKDPRPLPSVPGATPVAEIGPLRRFYYALAFSPRGRPGPPPSTIAELRLTVLPDAPSEVKATFGVDAVRLEWEPSGGVIGSLFERALPPELSPLDTPQPEPPAEPATTGLLQGPTRYNVYREIAPLEAANTTPGAKPQGEGGKPSAEREPPRPVPINPTPLETLTFADPLIGLDGRRRCYVVRSLRGDGAQLVEGMPSQPRCVEPVDDTAPDAPTRLTARVGDGEITLEWEPSAEPDIAGYLVLRGGAGDATLTPVTDTVVTDTRFVDRTVMPGVRYTYAVQAIDSHLPRPNVSVESARVEETAR